MVPQHIRTGLFSLLFILLFSVPAFAQPPVKQQPDPKEKTIIQLSGMVTASEGNVPVPFTTVRIKNTYRGTIAGLDGFYSMAVAEKDTVEFVAVGFKTETFVIPTQVPDQKLTHNESMVTDTFEIQISKLIPYDNKEEFKQAFLSLNVKDRYADMAQKNLDPQKLAELYETLARDGNESQIYALQAIAASYYYAGGQRNYMRIGDGNQWPVPTSLLNPFAWGQFIKDLKEGKFKKKK